MANNVKIVAQKVLDHLNQWPNKPVQIELETIEKYPTAIMMQQLAGSPDEKRFVNGTKICSWPFSVIVRTNAEEHAGKINAVSLLNDLDEWLSSSDLPDLGEGRDAQAFEMTSLPSLAGTYSNGTQDYQAVYRLIYKQEG